MNNEIYFELRYVFVILMYLVLSKIVKIYFTNGDFDFISKIMKVAMLYFMNLVIHLILITSNCILLIVNNEFVGGSAIIFILVSVVLCIYNTIRILLIVQDAENNFVNTYTKLMFEFSKSIYNKNKRYMDSPNTRYTVSVINCLVPLLNFIIIRSGNEELLKHIVDKVDLINDTKPLKEIKEDYEITIYIQLKNIEDNNLKEEIINHSREFFNVLKQANINYNLNDIMKYKEKEDNVTADRDD